MCFRCGFAGENSPRAILPSEVKKANGEVNLINHHLDIRIPALTKLRPFGKFNKSYHCEGLLKT